MAEKIVEPRILPGFMELLPADQILFDNLIEKIRKSYELFGFLPLDTPLIEKREVLLAKTGGETAKQIYDFKKGDEEIALRFDLTVPLARYVAKNYNDLAFPFRRYHIGKVYRGERPQRGRFREFYQCDIDIIGNENLSLVNDAEIPSVIYATFKALGFEAFKIRVNNRKVLNGFFRSLGIEGDASVEVLRIVDKIEKIGEKEVKRELEELGMEADKAQTILNFIRISGDNAEILEKLRNANIQEPLFQEGLSELESVVKYIGCFNVPEKNCVVDLTIARGLDYYTGTVYETTLDGYPEVGSVCSGGRYDNLADAYTSKRLPGVGISIGLTRLFYQLREAGVFKAESASPSKVIVIPLVEDLKYPLEIASSLRSQDIPCEVYLEGGKAKKKMAYADKTGIPFAIIIGEDEVASKTVTFKNMATGDQASNVSFSDLLGRL